MKTNIEKFLAQFPNNATKWCDATDEVRDLARAARETIEEFDCVVIEPLNFRSFNPSQWNTQGKKFILDTFDKMSILAKQEFFGNYSHLFN